jgi:hypothetical protein
MRVVMNSSKFRYRLHQDFQAPWKCCASLMRAPAIAVKTSLGLEHTFKSSSTNSSDRDNESTEPGVKY